MTFSTPANFKIVASFLLAVIASSISFGQTGPAPLIRLPFNEGSGDNLANVGTANATFTRSALTPSTSVAVPSNVGGAYSLDFGTNPGNYFVESSAIIDPLKNLSAFTISGWVNCASNVTGGGGNRIVSWINSGGDGVDLVYQSDGSLRLGVDGWPDASPAFSSAGKVPSTEYTYPGNWVFFAVTYQSNGQVQFYFGNNATDATLDVTRSYPGPGVTGSNINKLAIGAFNIGTRNSGTYDRMFRGLIDNIQIHNSILSAADIVSVQRSSTNVDITKPTRVTDLVWLSKTSTTASISWTAATDNVGVIGYELRVAQGLNSTISSIGPVTSYTVTGLPPATNNFISIRAKDAAGNFSDSYATVQVFTEAGGQEGSETPPLLWLAFNDSQPNTAGTYSQPITGSLYMGFNATTQLSSTNVPANVGGNNSIDFGSTPVNRYVESPDVIPQLKNLSAFTLTGWLNCRSNATGGGGNRVISWINSGGDGVDLVYQSDGSLRLGVDGWPDNSPAFSSPNKVPANAQAPATNWVFFAVTYQSNGQVQYYFGNNAMDAVLDVTRSYNGPGVTGSNIGKLAIGTFNDATRNPNTYDRMFRGLIDDIRIHTKILTPQNIVDIQRRGTLDKTAPTVPGNLIVGNKTNNTVGLQWISSADYYGVVAYDIYNGNTLIATTPSNLVVATVSYVVTGLTSGQTYGLTVKARDQAGNVSLASNAVNVTTDLSTVLNPLIHLAMNDAPADGVTNSGTLGNIFSSTVPGYSGNVPAIVGGPSSFNFPGGIALTQKVRNIVTQLKGMSGFTVTGWLNSRSPGTIISWLSELNEGVYLKTNTNGELVLTVDANIDASTPAISSAGKIPNDATNAASNWIFFAVTYKSDGDVKFYFGNNATDAVLDVENLYTAPGVTGSNINQCMLGGWRSSGSFDVFARTYSGLMDDLYVFDAALSPTDIVHIQRQTTDQTPPNPPTNIIVTAVTTTSITISWTAATDNELVTGYEIRGSVSNQLIATIPGNLTTYTISGLAPATDYSLALIAQDANFNKASTNFTARTAVTSQQPLISLGFDENDGGAPTNIGTLSSEFVRSAGKPATTTNTPNFTSPNAIDFDITPGNYYVESSNVIDGLKNLSAFTITGWLNNRSAITGGGGNRVVSWINSGGDGVDLVYQNNGSLRLGVDGWPDNSPAFSSANKITTDNTMSMTNWIFFAVTYQSNGQVQFYFGNTTTPAALDVTRTYAGPGVTGAAINKLAIGAFNIGTRNAGTYDRMFRGVIDEIKIFGTALTPQEIIALQNGVQSGVGRKDVSAQEVHVVIVQNETALSTDLLQNYPNPYSGETEIAVKLPQSVRVARINVNDVTGRSLKSIEIIDRGTVTIKISSEGINEGIYLYSLITDGKVVGSKRMMVRK